MKKAFIEQFLLGFLLILGTLTFVATSVDEYNNRNKIFDLKKIALQTGKAMAHSYEQNMDMCYSKTIAENILRQSALGQDLLTRKANGEIDFEYDFYDLEPQNDDGTIGDNQPDQVKVRINGYTYETFWYKFFEKESFTFNAISKDFTVDTPKTVTIRYGNRPNAAFENIFGTYQLDDQNCITNVEMHMANSKEWDKWEEVDSDGVRIPIADGIESPPTFVFAIANGNKKFDNPTDNAPIELLEPHCFNAKKYPKFKINDKTVQGTVGNAYTGNAFFEHVQLNPDGHNHFHIIPKSIYDKYINYKNNIYTSSGNEKDKYEAFKQYCDELNNDADPSNDIDYRNDPDDEYHYALEDLDANQSDMDFTDMLLDSTRLVKINDKDQYSVDSDRKIIFDSGYCEGEEQNIPPELNLTGCPVTIDEDTIATINWVARDSDGTIETKEAATNNGSATVNDNGTITYTPDLNFYGEDLITVVVKDNEDAIAMKECKVTITEVNDAPKITGVPNTIAEVNELYEFIPEAEDVDGDSLDGRFTIENKPDWLTFDPLDGRLSGTPTSSDVGLYENIVISVSDGRGGESSLPAFTIEVTGNGGPILVTPIPDQTIQEGKIFSYNVSPHFNDPDGDPLTYTIKAQLNGTDINWLTISADGQITSIEIPKGFVGSVITVTVTASDGNSEASDTFNITITNASDLQIFFHTFDKDTQGWFGRAYWQEYDNDGKLKITSNKTGKNRNARFVFNFGPEFANKDVLIEFDMYYSGGWESQAGASNQDFFRVKLNGTQVVNDSYGNGLNGTYGPEFYTLSQGKTDGDGMIEVRFIINVSDLAEFIFIDNVRVSLQ